MYHAVDKSNQPQEIDFDALVRKSPLFALNPFMCNACLRLRVTLSDAVIRYFREGCDLPKVEGFSVKKWTNGNGWTVWFDEKALSIDNSIIPEKSAE